jgi:hypothetical protein
MWLHDGVAHVALYLYCDWYMYVQSYLLRVLVFVPAITATCHHNIINS